MNENHPNDRYEQFVELFTKNERNLRSFVRSLLPTWHDADEVVQNVALVAWRKFDEFEPGTSFISWLCVIARFKVLSYRRKMARDRLSFSDQLIELMADEAEPEHQFRQHQSAALESCLNDLSDKHRYLVKIAYTPGFTVKEEAERAGLKPGALYMRLNRIRSLLLECVQKTAGKGGSRMSEAVTQQQKQWLDAYCNGTITESEFAKFHLAMEESNELRRFARQYLGVDSLLHEADITTLPTEQPAQLTRKFSRTNWLAVSAAVFLLGLGLGSLFFAGSQKHEASQENAAATSLNENSVARLVYVSNDAAFHPDCKLPTDGGSLLGKGWIQLDRGSVTILFNSGAKVDLAAPAVFGIDTPMRSYLEYGMVEVNAPESARDFVVATDSIEVVDLGTNFTLNVDSESGESDLLVTEGLVDLRLGSQGTKRQIQPVEAGYAAHIDASGAIVSLEESDRNTDSAPDPELLAHWSFDELNGGGIVGDSISQMDGRCRPESLDSLVDKNGRRSIDLSLNGSVDLNKHAKRFGESENCSFAFWLRNPRDGAAVIFSLSDGSERNRVQLHLNKRHVVYGWQSGELYDAISGRAGEWESDRWYHIVATLGEGVLRLYRDGVQIASGSYGNKIGTPLLPPAAVANLSHACIGRLSSGTDDESHASQWFGGQIDDFQFYSDTLSKKRIRELFEHLDREPETE